MRVVVVIAARNLGPFLRDHAAHDNAPITQESRVKVGAEGEQFGVDVSNEKYVKSSLGPQDLSSHDF